MALYSYLRLRNACLDNIQPPNEAKPIIYIVSRRKQRTWCARACVRRHFVFDTASLTKPAIAALSEVFEAGGEKNFRMVYQCLWRGSNVFKFRRPGRIGGPSLHQPLWERYYLKRREILADIKTCAWPWLLCKYNSSMTRDVACRKHKIFIYDNVGSY